MKKKRVLLLGILAVSLLAITLIEENSWFRDKKKIEIRELDHYEQEGNKVLIYYVSDTIWSEIEKHGQSLNYTHGKMTASFYYLDGSYTPDLSLVKNFYDAIDRGQTQECIAAAWYNQEYKFIKYPSRSWATQTNYLYFILNYK